MTDSTADITRRFIRAAKVYAALVGIWIVISGLLLASDAIWRHWCK